MLQAVKVETQAEQHSPSIKLKNRDAKNKDVQTQTKVHLFSFLCASVVLKDLGDDTHPSSQSPDPAYVDRLKTDFRGR